MKRETKDAWQLIGIIVGLVVVVALVVVALKNVHRMWQDEAVTVNDNLTTAADNFEVLRRVVFYNGITHDYIMEVIGRCSLTDTRGVAGHEDQLEVLCKTGNNTYKKHFLGLSDNVSYFSEHLKETTASAYHYRMIFKPQAIIPDIDILTSIEKGDLPLQNRGDE